MGTRAGTPVQNSMEELFGILNVLDPEKYDDEDEFLERFGRGMPTLEQVQDLQVRVPSRSSLLLSPFSTREYQL